ncbi:MAG: hypothetical protein JSW46_06175 [Gemmatimonadota bacterium]|nr:MAG: hypothetical protein JSW46_06175 [Gemmatimonadota bacterium]
MIASRIVSLVVALILTAQAGLFAQQEPPVAPGDRVRVTAPTIEPDPLVGTFIALGADTCVLEVGGRAEPLVLPLASVTNLEVSQGHKSKMLKGAVLGLLIGGFVGGVSGAAACSGDKCEASAGEMAMYCGAIGAVPGLFIGAGVGRMSKTDRWEEVPLDQLRVTTALWPRGGLSVGLRIRL